MDPLSGVASVFAVASLALQLIQTVDTVKTFVKDVKGASKELERLAELLDRLGALLQDVRELMERQTSLEHFPVPSNTIFACLKSCETSLGLLDDVVKKYGRVQGSNPSAVKRWKDDLKLAFKAKDIAAFEARIQRDIGDLHAAYAVNTANILTTVLPIMLLKQDTMVQSSSVKYTQNPQRTPANAIFSTQMVSLSSSKPHRNIKTRHEWIKSPLNRFGIRQKRTTKFLRMDSSRDVNSMQESDTIISECYETIVSLNMLGYACHWTRQYPYGNILPSLRVYPVVENWHEHTKLIRDGTIEEIQRAFASGALHPFTKDKHGNTLLDGAAQATRSDVYRLLQEYGVKPGFDRHSISQLKVCFMGHYGPDFASRSIDTLRLVLPNIGPIDRLPTLPYLLGWSYHSLDVAAWLWVNAAFHLYGSELINLRIFLAQAFVACYSWLPYGLYSGVSKQWLHGRVSELLVELMNFELIELYKRGSYSLLPALLTHSHLCIDSEYVGSNFLKLLTRLGTDVEACVRREIDNAPPDVLSKFGLSSRSWAFGKFEDDTNFLRWEWEHDHHYTDYLVGTEFSALTLDGDISYIRSEWPFDGMSRLDRASKLGYGVWNFETPIQIARFERRAIRNARKQRAQMGKKRVRSRMPGAWI